MLKNTVALMLCQKEGISLYSTAMDISRQIYIFCLEWLVGHSELLLYLDSKLYTNSRYSVK